MLCSIAETLGGASLHPALEFVITWAVLTILGALSIGVLSGSAFWYYYARPTFALWQYKMNPEFPHPRKVASEMSATLRGLVSATLCPATAIFLSQASRSGSTLLSAHAYCGVEPHYGLSGPAYLAAQFVVFWILSDFFEWGNHQIGHRFSWSWAMHRHHHVFANPSPWAVIADEPADQVIRTLPLLLLPLLFPTNIDLLFVQVRVGGWGVGGRGMRLMRLSMCPPLWACDTCQWQFRTLRRLMAKKSPPPTSSPKASLAPMCAPIASHPLLHAPPS